MNNLWEKDVDVVRKLHDDPPHMTDYMEFDFLPVRRRQARIYLGCRSQTNPPHQKTGVASRVDLGRFEQIRKSTIRMQLKNRTLNNKSRTHEATIRYSHLNKDVLGVLDGH